MTVQLFSPGADGQIGGGDDVEVNVGPDGILGTADDGAGGMVTAGGGGYLFQGLPAGDYYVSIPASEFGAGQELEGLISLEGHETGDTRDDHRNANDNGDGDLTDGSQSVVINLADNSEPTGEAGYDNGNAANTADDDNVNLTVDFGFQDPCVERYLDTSWLSETNASTTYSNVPWSGMSPVDIDITMTGGLLEPGAWRMDQAHDPAYVARYGDTGMVPYLYVGPSSGTSMTVNYRFDGPMAMFDFIVYDIDQDDVVQITAKDAAGNAITDFSGWLVLNGDFTSWNNPPAAVVPTWDPATGLLNSNTGGANENRNYVVLRPTGGGNRNRN